MEASMSRSLWCTITTCFSTGKTRKLAIIIALVLLWQYLASAADLYLHITAIGNSQQLPGLTIPSTRALDIATNCTETDNLDNCVKRKRGMKNHERVLKVYQNVSDSLVTWQSDDGIYLIQSPPLEKTYSYSGSGVFLRPSCKPISSICNLRARYGSMTNYSCPEEFWYASGNTVTEVFNVNITDGMHGPGPLHAIVTIRYGKELSTNYDSEFVTEVHGDLSLLLYCQIFSSVTSYNITLGVLKASPLRNLTSSQFFTLGQASILFKMVSRVLDDIEDISYKGNSTLFANAFAQKWAQATIASFSGIVQGKGEGEGYSYTLDVNQDQTIVPLSAILIYATVIILPLIIFSCVSLYSLGNRSDSMPISWILAEFLCTPQRLLYQAIIKEHYVDDDCLKNLAMQKRIIENIECNIKTDEGHIELVSQKFRNET